MVTSRKLAKELGVPHRKAIQAVKRRLKACSNHTPWGHSYISSLHEHIRISTYVGKSGKIFNEYILNEYTADLIAKDIKP